MRYIGSKMNLVEGISDLVNEMAPNTSEFCDIFAGTGAVGKKFQVTHCVTSNDILYFCFVLNRAHIGIQSTPQFRKLTNYLGASPIEYLNRCSYRLGETCDDDFVTINYTPIGPAQRMYMSSENGLRVDRIRQSLNFWLADELIDDDEYFYLLASLIEAVPSISNIAGTYGAFLKHWDPRSQKKLVLEPIDIAPKKHRNRVFNEDACSLVRKISGEVLYLDPPYNHRQYSSNYHVLESIARYDNPILRGKTGTRDDASGDSDFCRKGKVLNSLDELLSFAEFQTLIVSYSSDGLLAEDQLLGLVERNGMRNSLTMKKIPYRRYKRTANDSRASVTEFLIGINR